MLEDALIVALASALIVTIVSFPFEEEPKMLRGITALVSALVGIRVLGYTAWGESIVVGMASAYTALLLVILGERMATVAPVVLSRR